MSQISPPVRIILIGAVVFLAAWFTVLKPKPVEIEPSTTSTPPTATTTAPAKPETAQATTSAPDAKPQAAPAATIPAETLAKLPKDVTRALEARRVIVLGVISDEATGFRPLADDDRYVRNALRRVNRYDGDVFVKRVGITKLSTYGPLVNDLDVNQSPSIVVVDANLRGRVLTGYVDRISINQVIADARDAGTEPDIADPFLRELNGVCGRYELRTRRWSLPTVRGDRALLASADRLLAVGSGYRRAIARLDAPAKWRALKAETVAVIGADLRTATAMRDAAKAGDLKAVERALASLDRDRVSRLDRRFDDLGVTDCVANRRS